jgi:hypothetical protein
VAHSLAGESLCRPLRLRPPAIVLSTLWFSFHARSDIHADTADGPFFPPRESARRCSPDELYSLPPVEIPANFAAQPRLRRTAVLHHLNKVTSGDFSVTHKGYGREMVYVGVPKPSLRVNLLFFFCGKVAARQGPRGCVEKIPLGIAVVGEMTIFHQLCGSLYVQKGLVKPNIKVFPCQEETASRWKPQEPNNFWKSLNEMRCVHWLEEIPVRGVIAGPYVPSIRLPDSWMAQSVNGSLTECLDGYTDL